MAIVGIGTDIVEISRLERQLQRSPRLAERILTEHELRLFQDHPFPARYLAKRFAVKEAASKALGTGIGRGVSFQQFETRNDDFGRPLLTLSGKAQEISGTPAHTQVHVSISDEQHYAVATVIIERVE